jgi:hypothetical protein
MPGPAGLKAASVRCACQSTFPGPRSSAEIRAYLKTRLNQALRRPGMFGGEMALRPLRLTCDPIGGLAVNVIEC